MRWRNLELGMTPNMKPCSERAGKRRSKKKEEEDKNKWELHVQKDKAKGEETL